MEVIQKSNITFEEHKMMKQQKRQESRKEYFSNYYKNNIQNNIVYCSVCKKHLLMGSMNYHLNKSKEHQKNIIKYNEDKENDKETE